MPATVPAERSLLRPPVFSKERYSEPLPPAPWWATPTGVTLIVAIWALIHGAIAVLLEGAINVDDSIESFFVQSFEFSYIPRNPPVYDWLLYAIQQLTGPGPLSFAILRYGLLFACAMLVYRVAQHAIADPRLQALAVFSLSALWVIGYHSHRILTHSNVMIVAIAGFMLTLMALARGPRSVWLYAGLGAWIVVGVVGKFGFIAYFAALFIASMLEPTFRRVFADVRILVTLIVAAVPVAGYVLGLHLLEQDVVAATADVVGPSAQVKWVKVLDTFLGAWVGYLLPFLALVALVFLPWNRGEGAREGTPEQAAVRHVLRSMILIGTLGTLAAVLALGSTSLRDRYFHVFFLFAPVYVFMEAERLGGWQDRVRIYLAVLAVMAIGVMGVRTAITLWPDPRLCGRCIAAEPLGALRPIVLERLGGAPTLVAPDRMSAGRLRAAIPEARVVVTNDPAYRPPARAASGCGQITGVANGSGAFAPARMEGTAIDLWAKWWAPLMKPRRESFWQITPLPADSEMCR
ncbi:glycosyltransferase family 39 protein [Aquabacter spiritensis]|uniref:Glycosyltransferase RgtA/B/C/D-like domain-containing protein n=1 Tax=Aquabacter spiritensis TaxID=933073 RepID=A0A4R3LL24_9HYPH|nr:glycosyltransferase family 39 protein [Aquabacter spiritensis]TCT00973.1 hypothetical protein EDC64_12061 [Aquabacter spiritensis]